MRGNHKIFLIDDDEIFLMISSVHLKSACAAIEISTAANGEEGLKQLESKNPDVILLDINMPIMDGWEFLEKLSATRGGAPSGFDFSIYITSSSVDPADQQKAQTHPLVKGFIEKPLTAEKIRAMDIC